MKELVQQEADKMVVQRALLKYEEGTYVFSNGEELQYSLKRAGYKDRIRMFIGHF